MSTNISIKHIYILTTRCWCPISSSVINPHIQGLWHQVCSAESIEEHAEEWLELHPCNRGSLGLKLLMSKGKKHQIISNLRRVRPNHLWITWSHSPSDDLKGQHRFPLTSWLRLVRYIHLASVTGMRAVDIDPRKFDGELE